MNPFQWLGDLLSRITAFIPRFVHVVKTHGGVLFTLDRAKELEPGLYIYWPVWSSYLLYPVVRQTLNIPPQYMLCKEGTVVLASVTVVYRIRNVLKALVETYDLEDTIRDLSQGAVRKVLVDKTIEEIQNNQLAVDEELKKSLREALSAPFGVWVEEAFLSDFSPSTVYRVVGDAKTILPQAPEDDLEE